jgi:hypothetical protein
VLEAALMYAGLGWPVLPISREKKPLIRDWTNAASTDSDQITTWFKQFPDANVAVVTGSRSGLCVVDIDVKNDGPRNWGDLEFKHGSAPTLASRTGSGGVHLLYRIPEWGVELPNSAGKLAPGIDIRGEGGCIVLPPSVNTAGEQYTWVNLVCSRPTPNWIVEAVQATDTKAPRAAGVADGMIVEGTRNTTLTSLGGALRRLGAGPEAIEAALLAINATDCNPPLDEDEVVTIAKSISRYAPGDVPRDGALTEVERDWVEYSGLELAELPKTEADWVIPYIAAKGNVTLLAGQWKTAGKTTLLISAINEVLRGGTFLGAPVRRTPVVYLYEGPAEEFNQNDFAHQLHHPDLHLVPQDENAGRGWEEAIRYATRRCLELGAELLVIDTKTAWLSQTGDEENQSGFARNAMMMLAEAKLNGIAVVIAAHPTKNPTTLANMTAGSGQWAATAGRIFGIWTHTDAQGYRREIEAHGRQGVDNNLPRTVIEWDPNTNKYSMVGRVEDVKADAAVENDQADLERLLANFPDRSTQEEAEEHGRSLGFTRNRARVLLKLGEEQRDLWRPKGEWKSGKRPLLYSRTTG